MKKNLLLLLNLFILTSCSSGGLFDFNKKEKLPGERVAVSEKNRDLNVEVNLNEEIILPTPEHISNWNNDNLDSFNSNLFINTPGEAKQKFNFSSSNNLVDPTQPIVINNTLYIIEGDGVLSAYNFIDGQKIWTSKPLNKNGKGGFFQLFGDNFSGGGIKYHEGKIYLTTGLSEVICIDAQKGDKLWGAELSGPVRNIPLIKDNVVLIQTIDNKTYALNADSGEIYWNNVGIQDPVNTLSLSSVIINNNQAITHHSTDELYSLDIETGEEIWEANISPNLGVISVNSALINFSNRPLLDEGYIYAINGNGRLAKIDATNGEIIWRKDFKLISDTWVSGNYIFAISLNNKLIAINKLTGKIAWLKDINRYDEDNKKPKNQQYTSPIIINDEILIISSEGAGLFINPKNGQINKTFIFESDIYTRPIVADGSLVVISNAGKIIKY